MAAFSIPAEAAGVDLQTAYMAVSSRRLMSYAAALQATEDVYLNDLSPKGIVGLPAFIVTPEWLVMNGQSYRQALAADDARMWRCIHVQQDSRFLQPLVPGIELAIRGRIQVLRQTRIGVYVAVRLDTERTDTGEAMAESWFCGIFLGDRLDGADRVLQEPPALTGTAHSGPWQNVPTPILDISRTLPHLYTEAAAIWNPIHTERSAARDAGLQDTLLHGSCTWGTAGLYLIRYLAGGDPRRLKRLGARMVGKASVGASLFLRYRYLEQCGESGARRVNFEVFDNADVLVLAGGVAEIAA